METELQLFKAEFFKALGHPLRIRILELLAEGEKNVNELVTLLGVESSSVSQQLAVLRNKNIVSFTKEGNKVTYALRDPLVADLLMIARKIFNNHLISTIHVLKGLHDEDTGEASLT